MLNFELLKLNLRTVVPNRSESYYTLFENLDKYVECIVTKYIHDASVIELIRGSVNAAIVKITTPNAKLLLKIPSNKYLIPEIFFIKTLNSKKLPSPKTIEYDIDQTHIPYPYLITEWINGAESFAGHIDDQIAIDGGNVYAQNLYPVHQITVRGFGIPKDVDGTKWSCTSFVEALNEFFGSNIVQETPKLLYGNTLSNIEEFTLKNDHLNTQNSVLLHGDIPNGLMRINPTIQLLAFIDPAGIIGGDFLYDAASVFCINEDGDYGTGFMHGFRNTYFSMHLLNTVEKSRYELLLLFHLYWKSCFFHDHGWNPKFLINECLKQLDVVESLSS